jgi:hypothetical protein
MGVTYNGGSIGLSNMDGRPHRTFTYFEDFVTDGTATSDYTLVDINSAGAEAEVVANEVGGVIEIDVAAATDHDGGQLSAANSFVKLDRECYYETRVRFTSAGGAGTSKAAHALIGMRASPATAAMDAAADNQADDIVAFEIDADDGVTKLNFICCKDGEANETKLSDIAKIDTVANGGKGVTDFVRLGFSFRDGEVTVWVDGENAGSVSSNVPDDIEMGPIFAIASHGGTIQAELCIDYVMISQPR